MSDEKTEAKPAGTEDVQILFYCKTCQKVVKNPKKNPKRYEYTCPECQGDRVVFGTKNAICDYFHIKETMLQKMLQG